VQYPFPRCSVHSTGELTNVMHVSHTMIIIIIICTTYAKRREALFRLPEITRCSRRVHAPAHCRQTVENLITSNNKNGYLDAALWSQEDPDNGDNGCTNVRRLLASKSGLLFAPRTSWGRIKTGCCMIREAEGVIPIFSCNINSIITVSVDPVTLITRCSSRNAITDHIDASQRGNV